MLSFNFQTKPYFITSATPCSDTVFRFWSCRLQATDSGGRECTILSSTECRSVKCRLNFRRRNSTTFFETLESFRRLCFHSTNFPTEEKCLQSYGAEMEKRYAIKKLKIKVTDKTHKFIEVGNSGGVLWSFGQLLLRGYLGLSENLGAPFSCLTAFL